MEDLERYLDEIVEPTLNDFARNPTSVRHAFLACVATFHAVDYLAHPRHSRILRQDFNRDSHDFALVDDVAHAFKHVRVGNPANPDLTANEVITRPPGEWGKMERGLSRWADPIGGVTLDAAREIDLLDVVKGAVTFLRGKTGQPPSSTGGAVAG